MDLKKTTQKIARVAKSGAKDTIEVAKATRRKVIAQGFMMFFWIGTIVVGIALLTWGKGFEKNAIGVVLLILGVAIWYFSRPNTRKTPFWTKNGWDER